MGQGRSVKVERKRQVEAERRAAKDDAVRMEADRQAAAMKVERQATAVELAFQILYWLKISFRFILDC